MRELLFSILERFTQILILDQQQFEQSQQSSRLVNDPNSNDNELLINIPISNNSNEEQEEELPKVIAPYLPSVSERE